MTASRHLIDIDEFGNRAGLGKSAIYDHVANDPTFPKPVRISSRCTRWFSDEVDAWIAALPRGVGPRPGSSTAAEGA